MTDLKKRDAPIPAESAEEARDRRESEHPRLVPLLGGGVARVVHEHEDWLPRLGAQLRRDGLRRRRPRPRVAHLSHERRHRAEEHKVPRGAGEPISVRGDERAERHQRRGAHLGALVEHEPAHLAEDGAPDRVRVQPLPQHELGVARRARECADHRFAHFLWLPSPSVI